MQRGKHKLLIGGNVIIIGDSFCYTRDKDWAWPNLLNATQIHSYPGACEYRLWQQAKKFTLYGDVPLIFVHTSPYRIHTTNNTFHSDKIYSKSDIVITDALDKRDHPDHSHLDWYVRYCFDQEYMLNMHKLLLEQIIKEYPNAYHISWFDQPLKEVIKINVKITPNLPCHMDQVNNKKAYEQVKCILK